MVCISSDFVIAVFSVLVEFRGGIEAIDLMRCWDNAGSFDKLKVHSSAPLSGFSNTFNGILDELIRFDESACR